MPPQAASEPPLRKMRRALETQDPPADSAAAVKRWMTMIRSGSYASVQSSLRQGWAPVNATDAAGYTALMRCCVSGQLLEVLLGCDDIDVNGGRAPDGATALLLAARYRSVRTVHALLRRGAMFTRDVNGCSALHKASANSDPAVMRLLLHAQADPCARDREGRCPLATACLQCNEASVLTLLQWQATLVAKGAARGLSEIPSIGRRMAIYEGAGSTHSCRQLRSLTKSEAPPADASLAAPPPPPSPPVQTGQLLERQQPCFGVGILEQHAGGLDSHDKTGATPPPGLDGLPDDCLELLLQHGERLGKRDHRHSPREASLREVSDDGAHGHTGGTVGSSGSAQSLGRPRSAQLSLCAVPPASARASSAYGKTPARSVASTLACVCRRFRLVCRRRAVSAWLGVEGINAAVPCYYPRGTHTTLLHLTASEGMEDATEMLLERGAHPLALDASGRTALQVSPIASAQLPASTSMHTHSRSPLPSRRCRLHVAGLP